LRMRLVSRNGVSIPLFSSEAEDEFPVRDSCLYGLVAQKNGLSSQRSIIKFSDVFDTNMQVRDLPVINNFCKNVGVTVEDVLSVMYFHLSKTSLVVNSNMDKVKIDLDRLSHHYVDLNYLGWLKFHNISQEHYVKAVNFKSKVDSVEKCCICLAIKHKDDWCESRDDIQLIGTNYVTISPNVFTGDREPLCFDSGDGNAHYIMWNAKHDQIMKIDGDFIFWHAEKTYGHDHVHYIKGERIFRARIDELITKSQYLVNNDKELELGDVFHPIGKFGRVASSYGEDLFTRYAVVFAIQIIRIKFEIKEIDQNEMIVSFYKLAFSKLLGNIVDSLSNMWFAEGKFGDCRSGRGLLSMQQKISICMKSSKEIDAMERYLMDDSSVFYCDEIAVVARLC